jgi:hypothetical protein
MNSLIFGGQMMVETVPASLKLCKVFEILVACGGIFVVRVTTHLVQLEDRA